MTEVRWRSAGPRRGLLAVLALTVALVLAGCGGGGYTPAGPFRPLPEGAPPAVGPPSDSAPAPAPGAPMNPQSGQQAGDPNVVAFGLAVPTGLVILPDGTAIVGERGTGRLLKVFPDRSPARELMTVGGLDTTGDSGLLGLALSPTFAQDGLIYAYISTATDNRVVRFPLGGSPNPVLTGIPHGDRDNGGALVFAPDGSLYVGTGDTGNPALAQDPSSLAGKVLHIDVFGHPAGNGPVYSAGLADVTGLCVGGDGKLYATDNPSGAPAELDGLIDGGDFGWPQPTPISAAPMATLPVGQGALGGCAISGHSVFLGSRDGQRVDIVPLAPNGSAGKVSDVLAGKYGRLRTVVLDASGGLWITTSNRDGIGKPVQEDDRVLRIVPPTSSGNSPL
ncbi:MAG: putative oxidoreductase [Frankiales bacterium]|nr:putative oxidoreductase [Frankiales bacterium]